MTKQTIIPLVLFVLLLGGFAAHEARAQAKCGWFSERQFDSADGHVTRYRDTCEHVVCYALTFRYDDVHNSALSCVREP